jgi:hypothetical protein
VIPAGASNQQVDAAGTVQRGTYTFGACSRTLIFEAKSWEYKVTYPDGPRRVSSVGFQDLPCRVFNWQTYYLFTKPLAIPKGARLDATGALRQLSPQISGIQTPRSCAMGSANLGRDAVLGHYVLRFDNPLNIGARTSSVKPWY